MMELIYAQPGRIPWGQASAVSVHGMHILNRLTGLMKAAELEIKMNFHAGMPLVYI